MSRIGTTKFFRTLTRTGKVADNANFVIAHWYPTGSSNSIVSEPRITIPIMINGTTAGVDTGSNAGLPATRSPHGGTDGNGKSTEIFITETDGYGGSIQRSDGLFAADEYATSCDNGVSNVDWLELHNGSFLTDGTNAPNFAIGELSRSIFWPSPVTSSSPRQRLIAMSASTPRSKAMGRWRSW